MIQLVDKKLKQELVEKLSNFYESMPVYSIKKLSYSDMIKNGEYYASRFMNRDSHKSFRFAQRGNDSTLINLSLDVKMRIYHNSNAVIIKRKINPLEHLIKDKFDFKQLAEIAINAMNKLELDKWKSSVEQLEFESLWQIKASGISIEKTGIPVVLCRIVGAFRRHINKVPVYGGASIFVKIAGEGLIESVGIDWRPINENPINKVKIISPETAAEKILKDLNSAIPERAITTDDYKPEFFQLGYLSLPKRQRQGYMQPVYFAMFESVASRWNRGIIIPAASHVYEPVSIPPQARKSKKG